MQSLDKIETDRFNYEKDAIVFEGASSLVAIVLDIEQTIKLYIISEDMTKPKKYEKNGLIVDILAANRSDLEDRICFQTFKVGVISEEPSLFLQDSVKLLRMYGITLGIKAIENKHSPVKDQKRIRHYFEAGNFSCTPKL
ncbi:MAG: hypothetical protein PHY80_05935 [Rickettsiales bacterium]|nr:hypothetical protein [Rickettsiales bacterium]